MTECPCAGEKNRDWHRRRELTVCEGSKARHAAQVMAQRRKNGVRPQRRRVEVANPVRWIVGSSILVPEIDPL